MHEKEALKAASLTLSLSLLYALCRFLLPALLDESVVHVSRESWRLVLAAMTRFPLNEQLQGLSCLALANLSLRHGTCTVFELVTPPTRPTDEPSGRDWVVMGGGDRGLWLLTSG